MSGTYAGTVQWHDELTVIEDGDDAIGETFTAPDQQVYDHTIALRDEVETSLLRSAVVLRTALGAGTISDASFGSETGKLIYGCELEICGGGQGGGDGGVAKGGTGGVSGGYQRRVLTFSPPISAFSWSCYVGAGGTPDAPKGVAGEASWIDMGDYGIAVGRGGDGTSSGITESAVITVSVNGTDVRSPTTNLDTYPPELGWGCVRSGVYGAGGGDGTRGSGCHCRGGAGGVAGSVGASGRGYGGGGGGGCQASGTASGGGGGGGGWLDAGVSAPTASGSTGAVGKQGAIRVRFLYSDIMGNV